MPAPNNSFGSFIDHYIVLLAARFNAELEDASLCSKGSIEPWEKVARCVRDVLAHPQTREERREVAHIDVDRFDWKLCYTRARYVAWQQQEHCSVTATAAKTAAEGLVKTEKLTGHRKHGRIPVSSTFDITRDSLRNEVQSIYSATRASLPNTFTAEHFEGGDGTCSSSSSNDTNKEECGKNDGVEVIDFPIRSEAEIERDHIAAQARDELLTKVQAMQAEFFQQHRRWVDVSLDMDLLFAPGNSGNTCSTKLLGDVGNRTGGLSKSVMREALEVAASTTPTIASPQKISVKEEMTPKAKANGGITAAPSSVSLFEVLRRGIHSNRPPRPSQMREEDYQAQYDGSTGPYIQGDDFGVEEKFSICNTSAKTTDAFSVAAVPPKKEPTCLPVGSTANGTAMQLRRANRWSVLEYDADSGEESDDEKKG